MTIDISTMTISELRDLSDAIQKQLASFGLKMRKPWAGRPAEHDYSSWDWTKKNKELAAEHDVAYYTVVSWRHKLGKDNVCGGKHWPACKEWDWSKSDTQIAREQKVEICSVKKWRARLKMPAAPRDFQAPDFPEVHGLTQYDWSKVDWNTPDIQIARLHGMTRERVRQKRAALGLPKCLNWDWKYQKFVEAFKDAKELKYSQVQEKLGNLISRQTFYKHCAKAGIKVLKNPHPSRIYRYDLMNWDLPNKLLMEIWRVPRSIGNKRYEPGAKVAMHRCNFIKPKAAFTCFKNRIPDEWLPVVEAERKKAQEWFASQNNIPENSAGVTEPVQQ